MTPEFESLRARLSGEARVSVTEAERVLYARDCWPYLSLTTRAGRHAISPPCCVVFPAGLDDVIETVRWSRDHRIPIVPFGAGSGVAGGTVPLRGALVIDLKVLTDLDDSFAASGLIRVGAGWLGARLEHELNRRGLTLGHFPSSIGCSTVGGYLATRSAGQLSTRHGKIEDMVVGLRWLDRDGILRETWSEAHDSTQLLVGSEGTLGLIVDAWLRVEPMPSFRRARGYACPSVDAGLAAIRDVMQSGHRPAVMRLYDEFDTFISGARKAGRVTHSPPKAGLGATLRAYLSGRFDGAEANRLALAAANGLLSRTLGAPLVLNRLARSAYDECLLIVGVEEADEELADAAAEDIFGAVGEHVADLGSAPGEHWYAHRYDVSYKLSPMIEAGFFVDTMEVAAPWSRLLPLYDEVKRTLGRHVFVMAHFSHAYVTGCSIYFTFAGFGRDDSSCIASYRATWEAGMDAVLRAGGAVTHHHGVGMMKSARLYAEHENGERYFAALKAAVDSADLLNPGKLWHSEGSFL